MSTSVVPFFRPDLKEQDVQEVVDTLRSGWLTTGKRVRLFEQQFAAAIRGKGKAESANSELHAVALNSCTAALHLGVEALGLKAGQGVLVPTMTFAATAEVVRYLGAVPVLVDCDPVTLNMDLDDAGRKLATDYTDFTDGQNRRPLEIVGIIPVHVGGMMMDVDAVKEFAGRHNLWIVEDAAHAFPAAAAKGAQRAEGTVRTSEVRGQRSEVRGQTSEVRGQTVENGTHRRDAENAEVAQRAERNSKFEIRNSNCEIEKDGDQRSEIRGQKSELRTQNRWQRCGEMEVGERRVVCFSFYANKTITTGEGGMAVTGDETLAQRMRLMSLHGLSQDAWERYSGGNSWDYKIIAPGFKYNLTDIAAAIGIHQLARAEAMRCERESIAKCYLESLADVDEIELPLEDPRRLHAWHLFPIRLRLEKLRIDRNQFVEELKQAGVGCSVHWRPLHLHPYYQETFGWKPEDFPVATAEWQRLISLPIFPGMRGDEIDYVVTTVREICRRHSVVFAGQERFSMAGR